MRSRINFTESQVTDERNPNIKFSLNIADTIWIPATYRIFKSGVKP